MCRVIEDSPDLAARIYSGEVAFETLSQVLQFKYCAVQRKRHAVQELMREHKLIQHEAEFLYDRQFPAQQNGDDDDDDDHGAYFIYGPLHRY